MSGRIHAMRTGVRARSQAKGTPGTFNHITDQIGMFSFTGLTEAQVKLLREMCHVYMVSSSRAPFLLSSRGSEICIRKRCLFFFFFFVCIDKERTNLDGRSQYTKYRLLYRRRRQCCP